MTVVLTSIVELQQALARERASGRRLALVPTMGALHDGHLALVAHAREVADIVVVSIFVNPLQFGPSEDLDRYPRDLDTDLEKLSDVHYVFAPTVAEMYPDGESQTRVTAGHIATLFEGASRPGHFDGMLTAVAKLLGIVQPDVAVFGQKDAQQVYLVKRMVADLNFATRIDIVETVRENGGLALSSRNQFLDAGQKRAALALSAALAAAAASAPAGVEAARSAAAQVLAAEPDAHLDYFEMVDPDTFLPAAPTFQGEAVALIAARVGTTRLIDNRAILFP